jgi:hypothetical protein
MPTIILKVDLPGAVHAPTERPSAVSVGLEVPVEIAPASGQPQHPDVNSLVQWRSALSGVAFVGVISTGSGKI